MKVFFDFETRSACDLRAAGTHVYAKHPSTDILCMAWAVDDGEVKIYRRFEGDPVPNDFFKLIKDGATFVAHNATFEKLIWEHVCHRKYGRPKLPVEQLECSMVMAYSMGLQGSLDNAAKCVGMEQEKDMAGSRIMLQLAQPRDVDSNGKITWWERKDSKKGLNINEKYERLYAYCAQDIVVSRELYTRLLPLDEGERKTWLLDQGVNDRGVYIDKAAAEKAIAVAKEETKSLNARMQRLTNQQVSTCNAHAALKKWVNGQGVETESLDKAAVNTLLEGKLPKIVRDVIETRKNAAKSSVNKINRMLSGMDKDGRVKGCFQFYGAASTGRWAGRRIQLHNLPRPKIKQDEIESIMQLFGGTMSVADTATSLDLYHGSPLARISDCLRAMLVSAPNHKFIAADFSSVEARVLAWLAGEEQVLNVFRSGKCIYRYAASGIYSKPYDSIDMDERLIGKVSILALGFQGGVGAFQSMAKNYFLKISDEKADAIKMNWRAANPRIVNYWYALEDAAISAYKNPNEVYHVGAKGRHVSFLKRGSFLLCKLPSGRVIVYPFPQMKEVTVPWGDKKLALTYKGEKDRKFVRIAAYGGLLAENITQAVARDLLKEAMFRWEKNGYKIVLHVHDELVSEVKDDGEKTLKEAERLMCEVPAWAKGMPIEADGWEGYRFRK